MKAQVRKSIQGGFVITRQLGKQVVLALSIIILTTNLVLAQEGEKKVSIDQVPAKVKAAILKAVGNG